MRLFALKYPASAMCTWSFYTLIKCHALAWCRSFSGKEWRKKLGKFRQWILLRPCWRYGWAVLYRAITWNFHSTSASIRLNWCMGYQPVPWLSRHNFSGLTVVNPSKWVRLLTATAATDLEVCLALRDKGLTSLLCAVVCWWMKEMKSV